MSTDKQISMLDELQGLLEQQLELARQGNSGGKEIEILGMQADCLIKEITKSGMLERPEFQSRRKKLKKSYEDLCLAVTAQKTETNEKLCHLRRGRNIIETYRSNI